MESVGKFQVYYTRILKEVTEIKEKYGYSNLSKAFAHWYLEKFQKMSLQDIAESIIDGNGDNGIDAIMLTDDSVLLFQFKFPEKQSNIDKAVDEKTALKIVNGYQKLTSQRKPRVANDAFIGYWSEIKHTNIFSYKYIFVSYTGGLSRQAQDALETHIESVKEATGNEIKIETITKKRICDLIDKSQKRSVVDIRLKYSRLDPSYNLGNTANSWSGFASAQDVLAACMPAMDVIFDENIRLYEGNVPVNEGIKKTASTSDSCYFYFFHNGIVFICDECKNSTGNQTAQLSAASVVNGCQTIVSLKEVLDKTILRDDVFLPIRIIETDDFDLRAKITEYLNSQSKIKDSYFLANNTFIKELQSQLLQKGYFLERLANEYSYKTGLGKISAFEKDHILSLEKTIQVYIAFYNNSYAATAKRGKNDLFNREQIDSLITAISADQVLTAYKYYNKICDKITLYRKCRRSKNQNSEFLHYLGLFAPTTEQYELLMQQYVFMNTADLLLLNAFHNLKKKPNSIYQSDEDLIKCAITICKDIIVPKKLMLPSAATKNSTVFEEVQKACAQIKSFN